MTQRDVILSMVEAVSCTLNEAKSQEITQAQQFDIVLRSIPFFNEILSMVNSQTAHKLTELRTTVNDFLNSCNRCMIFISKEAQLDNLNLFIDFLNNLISSCLVSECIDSMSHLLVGILNTRDIPNERVSLFSKIFKTFFLASDLRSEFIKGDGILTAWFTYVAEPENPLILLVFELFETYLEFFALPDFSSHITDLVAAVSASFASLSLNSAKFIFTFIQKIVAFNPKFYIQKLDENLFFQSIYLFIIQHQDDDPNLISYLEFFTTLIPFSAVSRRPPSNKNESAIKIPSLDMTINLISAMECKVPLRHRALKGIENILRYVTVENMPFSTDQISLIANAIPIDDPESVYIFSTICLDLNIQANFDISPLIPFLQRFMTIDLLLTIDMTKYISLFLEYQQEVSPFMPALYISVFQKLTPEIFSDLVNRYGHLFAFIFQHFTEPLTIEQLDEFMRLLIMAFPYYHDVGGAESCLTNIITSKKGYIFTHTIFDMIEKIASTTYLCDENGLIVTAKNEEVKKENSISPSISSYVFSNQTLKPMDKSTNGKYNVSGLLRALTKTIRDSFSFRSECIHQEIYYSIIGFYKKFGISGNIILDFLAALSNHIYIPLLDAAVYVKLKEIDFMNMNKQQLLRFALGLQQTEKSNHVSTDNQANLSEDLNINSSKESNSNSLETTVELEENETDQKQKPILSFLANEDEQQKEILIDDEIDNVHDQIFDHSKFKPFNDNNNNPSKITLTDLNDGFSETSNLSDQNSSNSSIRKYSSSFTPQNFIYGSIQGTIFSIPSSSAFDDDAIATKAALPVNQTDSNKNLQTHFEQTSPKKSSHSSRKKKRIHTSTNSDKAISSSFPHGALCFPSILGHCDDYVFSSRYDLWVCGRVGLYAWLRDSGRPISEFPSIVNVASQYARREHLEMLIDYPQIFYKTCENLTKLPPLFEFKKSFDCSFSVSPSSSTNSPYISTPGFYVQNIKSFCLWFQVSENVQDVTNFVTINSNIQLFLLNHDILFEGNPIGSYEIGKWVFFAATSEPQSNIINVYLDLKMIFKIQNKYGFNPTPNCRSIVTFGGKHCKATWFIGGTIRFFSEPATLELLSRIYSSGVSSVLSIDQLNINANNKTQSFETIRKSATMSAPLFGDEYIKIQMENNDKDDTVTYISNYLQFANIVNGSYLDRKERPVPIYSLLNYIQNVKAKPNFIIRRALKHLQKEDYESANYLLKSLCILKKNKVIKQSNESFALSISILFHIAPKILTDDTIDLIISCFETNSRIALIKDKTHTHEDKNVGYDWNSFFVFAFDYSLMYSSHSVVLISKFFELNARYPIIDVMSRYSLTLYLFSLLAIPEFDKSLNESILDFILKLNPDSSLLFFLLASYPNMAISMSDNTQPYYFDEKEEGTILLILKLISNLRIKQFNYYILLNVLPSSIISKLVRTLSEQHLRTLYQQQQSQGKTKNSTQYLTQQNSPYSMRNINNNCYALESLDFNEIFDSLLYTVFMPESWFSAISICTSSLNIDDLHNFTLNHFDMNLFEPFFKMFTLLSCACFRINEDSFWIRFAALLSEQMILIIPSIPEKIITKTLKFWVLQLMTFGQPFDKMSTFPPYPLAFTSRDVLEYIETREQKYPTNYGKPFTFQPVSFPFCSTKNNNPSNSNNPKIYNEMLEQVYNYVDFVSPKVFCLNGVAKYHVHHKRHQKIFKEIFDENITYIAKDWVEFVNNIIKDFNLDKELISVKEHPLTDILIRLLSSFVVHCPPLFQTIFNTMSIFPNDLMMILVHKITICSLNLCEHQKIFHQQLIDLACKRALEGWYTAQYVAVIQHIFKIVNQCFFNDSNTSNSKDPNANPSFQLPISFYNAIVFGFDVIPFTDVPKLLSLISNYRYIFINHSFIMNFDLCLTFISQMLKYINSLTDTFYQLWSYFVSLIKSYDQFQIQWNKTYALQQSKLIGMQQVSQADAVEFSTFLSFLMIIEKSGAKGFNNWKEKNSKVYNPFEKLLSNTSNNYHKQVLNEIATEIDSLVKIRNEKSVEFIRISNSIIIERSKKVSLCKAKAACLRQIFREHFIFMNLFFIRRRENYVSQIIPINFNNKESGKLRKAISILSDPIFPTRRLEKSPLGYKIPSFPDGTYNELFPEKPSTLPVFDDINYSASIRELFSYEVVQVPFLLRYSPFQLHAKFTQFLPIQPYQNLTLLSLLINKGSNFHHICNCSLLYGIETLNGCLFVCENSMFFGEGFMIDEENKQNGFTFINQNQSLPYFFYLQNIMTNHFGRYTLYQGHPIIEWVFDDIICAYPHIWIHKPYSIALNFIRGFNFVLNFKKQDYDYIFPLLKRYSSSFFDSAPPISSIQSDLSIINSARYLQLTNKEITNKWQNGEIDTFTYLCILNRFGKRPTCDMTQYPVFPWIISDFESDVLNLYPNNSNNVNDDVNKGPSTSHSKSPNFRDLSLPMGQIGKKRSERFNEFYKDTNNQYYYGTHYMHYGVVLYFMFRVDPFTFFSIELNKGWDHPNRVFYNLADSWKSAAFSSPTDLKEVIPQFFLVPEIFNNTSHLPLTTNDDGASVDSVKLPKWAKNARDMSDILLKLMECDYVQKNINFWIDLIFGDKSRGQSAREVKNLFHPLCYAPMKKHREIGGGNEDNDPDNLEDDVSREASIISIINFGQCPQQVMNKPHPQIKYRKYWRILSSPIISPLIASSIESLAQASRSASKEQLLQQQKADTEESSVSFDEATQMTTSATSEGKSMTLCSNNEADSSSPCLTMLSELISHAPMSLTANWQRLRIDSFFMPPYVSYCDNTNTVLTSNHVISAFIPPTGQFLYVEDGAVMLTNKNLNEAYKLAENDIFLTISAVSFSQDGFYLTMALKDGSFMLYKLLYVKGEARYPKLLHVFSAYDDDDECFLNEDGNLSLKAINSNDSETFSSCTAEQCIERVHDIVSICVSSEHLIALAASGNRVIQFDIGLYSNMPSIKLNFPVKKVDVDDQAALIFATGDYDIAVISISGEVLMQKKIENQPEMAITCMTTSKLPQYFIGRFFTTGHANGKICFWSVSYSENELQQIGWVKLSDEPIISVCLSSNSQRMIAGTKSEVFSCECQNISGSVNKNLINAIRIASDISKMNTAKKESQEQIKQNNESNQQKVLDLHENDDGFIVIDINKQSSNNTQSSNIDSLTTPIVGFEYNTMFVPFIAAASGPTGGYISGTITNIGSGSGGGSSVSCIPLKKEIYASECASCRCDIKKNAFVCSKCGRFFCQKCITKEINALKTTITCVQCMPPQSNIETSSQSNI